MTIELWQIGRARVATEAGRAAFGVDQTGTPANFIDVPIVEGTIELQTQRAHLAPNIVQQWRNAHAKHVLGARSATLGAGLVLHSTGTAYTGQNTIPFATSANYALRRILAAIMGVADNGTVQAAATTVQSGSTASTINVTAGHGNTLGAPGRVIGVVINGRVEAREILSVTANSVTVKQALSAAPAAGAAVYWGITFALAEDPVDTLQWILEGYETTDRFAVFGSTGNFSIELALGELPKIALALQAASWARMSPAALAAATYANHLGMSAVVDSEFIVGTGTITSTQVRNVVPWTQATWTPAFGYLPIRSPAGVQTHLGFRGDRSRGVTGQFTTYLDGSGVDWWARDADRSDLSLWQQIGSTAGSIVCLSAPTAQITASPVRADAGGLVGVTVSWEGRNDEAIASPASDRERSAFRIHVL